LYFGSVKFFRHLIVVTTALFIAASLALVILFAIENKNLKRQLEEYEALRNIGETTDNVSDTTDTDTVNATDETTEGDTSPQDVWPPAPSGEYAGMFPDLYAVNAPWELVLDEDAGGHVYLTFDDGPNDNAPNYKTTEILNYLKEKDVSATFFVVPRESSASVLRRIDAEGHTIGVHSYTHAYEQIYESVEAFLEDFNQARTLIYEQTGILSDIFRYPGGSINDYNKDTRADIIAEMERRGFICFDWNVDSNDTKASYDTMIQEVPKKIHENYDAGRRSIVLFHDNSAHGSWVVRPLIKLLDEHQNEYEFRTLSPNVRALRWSSE